MYLAPENSGDPLGSPGAGLDPRTCLQGGKGARPLYPPIDQALDVGWLQRGIVTLGEVALFSQGQVPGSVSVVNCQHPTLLAAWGVESLGPKGGGRQSGRSTTVPTRRAATWRRQGEGFWLKVCNR